MWEEKLSEDQGGEGQVLYYIIVLRYRSGVGEQVDSSCRWNVYASCAFHVCKYRSFCLYLRRRLHNGISEIDLMICVIHVRAPVIGRCRFFVHFHWSPSHGGGSSSPPPRTDTHSHDYVALTYSAWPNKELTPNHAKSGAQLELYVFVSTAMRLHTIDSFGRPPRHAVRCVCAVS